MSDNVGQVLTFKALEDLLFEKAGRFVIVKSRNSSSEDEIAVMHWFIENFCGDWLSGDGVLFWEDGEVTSADENDEFELLQIIDPPFKITSL